MTNKEIEEGTRFAPRFDVNGLISAIVVDEASGQVLMLAHMNVEALERTIATREAWFYSRSRKQLWRKGETSGNTLKVSAMKVDCDQDAVLLAVKIEGGGKTCHTGRRSCFYREVALGGGKEPLTFAE